MAKSVKSLTGPEKDAFLRRALAAESAISPATVQRLAKKLERDLTRVWVRSGALDDTKPARNATSKTTAAVTPAQSAQTSTYDAKVEGAPIGKPRLALGRTKAPADKTSRPPNSTSPTHRQAAASKSAPFDPYSPNVIVVLRKSGREQVLEALSSISEAEQLRLLAREQQLGIAQDLVTLDEIRLAIVAAAERRIANRRAAGG